MIDQIFGNKATIITNPTQEISYGIHNLLGKKTLQVSIKKVEPSRKKRRRSGRLSAGGAGVVMKTDNSPSWRR